MLSEELRSIYVALGGVLGRLNPEETELVRQCRRNLDAAAEQADALESNLGVVSVDVSAGEAEIALPVRGLMLTVREVKLECVLSAKAIREMM